jgi:SagB-type dehydrogenase family enzyme
VKGRNQLRHDLNHLISAGILVAVVVASVTGIVAHLWDLNDFVYHVYAGYVLLGFSVAHVAFNWKRLVNYFRWRLGKRSTHHQAPRPATTKQSRSIPAPQPIQAASATPSIPTDTPRPSALRHLRVTRRGVVGMTVAAVGGVFFGRRLEAQPDIPYGSDLGVVYHEWSKPGTPSVWGTIADWGGQPPRYKAYPDVPYITLPEPRLVRGLHTEDAIQQRRSARTYSGQPMTLDELSRLLSNTGSENVRRWGHNLRTAPSSGALFPIETYLVVHNVQGLDLGLYHYAVEHHGLHQLRVADLRSAIVRQGVSQGFLGTANIVIVFTSIFQRMRWKYQQRSYRYALLEAGHLGQNVCLAATSMGLGACTVGAFMDRDLDTMLGIDGYGEASLYIIAAGKV